VAVCHRRRQRWGAPLAGGQQILRHSPVDLPLHLINVQTPFTVFAVRPAPPPATSGATVGSFAVCTQATMPLTPQVNAFRRNG
jgi:hypothetical protein